MVFSIVLLVVALFCVHTNAIISVDSGKSVTHVLAAFSPSIEDDIAYQTSLIHIEDSCDLKDWNDLDGLIVISKGVYKCSYMSSTLNVQKKGAVGIMMFTEEPGVGFMLPPADDLSGRSSDVAIQMVLITKEEGEALVKQLDVRQRLPILFQPDQDRSLIIANNVFIYFFLSVLSVQLLVTLYFAVPGFIKRNFQWPVELSFIITIIFLVAMWLHIFLDLFGSRGIMPLAASQIFIGISVNAIMCLTFLLVYVWEHAMKFNSDMVKNIKNLKLKLAISWGALLASDLVRIIMIASGTSLYIATVVWCCALIIFCIILTFLFYYYGKKLLLIFGVFSSQQRTIERRFVKQSSVVAAGGAVSEVIILTLWIFCYDIFGTKSRLIWNWIILFPTLFSFTTPNTYGYLHTSMGGDSNQVELSGEKSSGSSKFTTI